MPAVVPALQTVAANRFELQIVALSSSLSLNVIGTFKEMVTIGFSVLIFGDPINVRRTIMLVSGLHSSKVSAIIVRIGDQRPRRDRDG